MKRVLPALFACTLIAAALGGSYYVLWAAREKAVADQPRQSQERMKSIVALHGNQIVEVAYEPERVTLWLKDGRRVHITSVPHEWEVRSHIELAVTEPTQEP